MLRTLDIEASPAAEPLLVAVGVLRSDGTARPTGFLRVPTRFVQKYTVRTRPEPPVLSHCVALDRAPDRHRDPERQHLNRIGPMFPGVLPRSRDYGAVAAPVIRLESTARCRSRSAARAAST